MLETGRLLLRWFEEEDAPFVLRLLNEPDFLRYIGDRGVRSEDDARSYIETVPRASYREHGFGPYLVEWKGDGAAIGLCGLMRRTWLEAPDLAYAFLGERAGRGYASEAARAVLGHAREGLGLPRVLAIVQPDNTPSIRVLEKVGMRREGRVVDPRSGDALELHATPPP